MTITTAYTQSDGPRIRRPYPLTVSNGGHGLKWKNAIAQSGELLVGGQAVRRVGDPSRWEAHQPFHERG